MPPFSELASFVQGHVLSDPGHAVREVYDTYASFDMPTLPELKKFLTHFANSIDWEEKKSGGSKKLHSERASAIKAINKWVAAAKDPSPCFNGVGLVPFAYQLALRVRKPVVIDQSNSRLCASVAMLYSYAKESPTQFADFGMSLYDKGSGSFKTLQLEPTTPIRNGFVGQKAKASLCEADYVMLVSLRQCGDVTNLGNLTNVANETLTAGSICAKLDQAGYKNVEDHTFVDAPAFALNAAASTLGQPIYHTNRPNPPKDPGSRTEAKENLSRAQQDLAKGRFVLMMAHGDISEAVRAGQKTISHNIFTLNSATKTAFRHFTAVRGIAVGDSTVRLRVITWGARYDGELNLDDFLAHYEGYVSASPV